MRDIDWGLVVGGIVLAVVLSGSAFLAYDRYNSVCIRWEDSPRSEACVRHQQFCHSDINIDSNGHAHPSTSCTTRCVEYQPCRSCTLRVNKDSPAVPPELNKPQDACDLVERKTTWW